MNIVKGEVHVDVAGQAPVEKIIEIGNTIWNEVKSSGVPISDDSGNDKLLKDLGKKHHDFAISFPIVLRWMVQAREFDSNAFEKYLKGHVKAMYRNRKEFINAQGEYLVILYKTRKPRAGAKDISRYRDSILKSLEKDDKLFMDANEQATKEVEEFNKKMDAERRQRLYEYLMNQRSTQAQTV